ncbi:alpha/beta hydrolase [Nonomuraea terrae]|uniref:Alpha/beta hydrolase n=1 Tax=Nonomuraea terrae TaxID=2530383 RepID=A0A4R4YYD3_9ACTN|nr:alpha/beta hydrolase [Nonomuraea terrae]TDD50000.1 alpha/beta hydrolase [Nonomuraea terrae]
MTDEETRVLTTGGQIDVREVGQGTTALFVHGLMVNGHVWDPLIAGLRDRFRMVLPDLPLGGHRTPLEPDADCGLQAHAQRVVELARRLPPPVVLIGSDTGGAIAQIAVTLEPDLFDRLVLLPSDAFDNCPPRLLAPMRLLADVPGAVRAVALSLRLDLVRRAMMLLVSRRSPDPALLDVLLGELPGSRGVQRDFAKLLRGLRPEVTQAVAKELHRFRRPVLVVWSRRDPLFPFHHAQRLASCFSHSSVAIAENSRAFVSLDEPEWLAARIAEFVAAGDGRPQADTR